MEPGQYCPGFFILRQLTKWRNMQMMHTKTITINNEEVYFETGRMAKQANGAIFARCAGSAVIATACCSSSATEGLDFVPVTVEYNEKYYAAGKIPGGFIKREARPKDREILISQIGRASCRERV